MKPSRLDGVPVAEAYSLRECCLCSGCVGVDHASVCSSDSGKRWMCESMMG